MRRIIPTLLNTLSMSVFVVSLIAADAVFATEPLPKGIMKLNGQTAFALHLNDIDGEEWNVSESRGHWVFLHFWASWCGPCREEMPTIQAIVNEFEDSDIEIVLVNTAESEDMVFEFLAAVAPDLNSLLDVDGQATEVWQPRGLPATFFIDPSGKLQYLALGGRAWDTPVYSGFLKSLAGTD